WPGHDIGVIGAAPVRAGTDQPTLPRSPGDAPSSEQESRTSAGDRAAEEVIHGTVDSLWAGRRDARRAAFARHRSGAGRALLAELAERDPGVRGWKRLASRLPTGAALAVRRR